jgi:hypothetical protein
MKDPIATKIDRLQFWQADVPIRYGVLFILSCCSCFLFNRSFKPINCT